MKLIADSGSTKTAWILADGRVVMKRMATAGINPAVQAEEDIVEVLRKVAIELPEMPESIHFYGAGCRGEAAMRLDECMHIMFSDVDVIEVESDLLGAARALFGSSEGIACILGTGSNSCLYDGMKIRDNIPPLGFILGDEGSGAVLGRMFLNALFKGRLPRELREQYLSETGQTYDDIIRRVYREPNANRYLASTSLFIAKHMDVKSLVDIVEQNIEAFFVNNVCRYNRTDLPVAAVGSIAHAYACIYNKVAERHGYHVERIIKEPIDALVEYHSYR